VLVLCVRDGEMVPQVKWSLLLPVPQVLGMMVELEEDPDWAVADEIEDEDNDRCVTVYTYSPPHRLYTNAVHSAGVFV